MLDRILARVYELKKTVMAAVAGAYAIAALAQGGLTAEEAQAAQVIVFGVIAVYLAANEYIDVE